jgi:AraC-like DNA-binding protein
MDSEGSQEWYREVPPPPSLARLVASLWETRIPALGDARVRIMPNACVDIVVYASDTSRGEGAATIVAPPHRSFVVGSTLRSFVVRSTGWRHVVGASILPAGVQPILGMPARIIGETIAVLDDIIGAKARELEDRVIAGEPFGAMQRLADALIMLKASRQESALLVRAVESVRQARGVKRIDDIASDSNISPRQLERHFLEHVGMPPKTFSRLIRFDRVVRDIPSRGSRSWTAFALQHGYSDQAHFINVFKEFAGITPAQFEDESSETLLLSPKK